MDRTEATSPFEQRVNSPFGENDEHYTHMAQPNSGEVEAAETNLSQVEVLGNIDPESDPAITRTDLNEAGYANGNQSDTLMMEPPEQEQEDNEEAAHSTATEEADMSANRGIATSDPYSRTSPHAQQSQEDVVPDVDDYGENGDSFSDVDVRAPSPVQQGHMITGLYAREDNRGDSPSLDLGVGLPAQQHEEDSQEDVSAEVDSHGALRQDHPMDSIEEDITQQAETHRESALTDHIVDAAPGSHQDENSLFIPECAAPRPGPYTTVPSTMLPPSIVPVRRKQSGPSSLTFDKIREMQRKLKNSKTTGRERANAGPSLIRANSNDPLINTVLNGHTASGGHKAAEDSEYEMEDKRAREEFLKEKRKYDALRLPDGRLSFQHDLQWAKIRGAEEIRLKKRKRDMQKLQEELGHGEGTELFPQDELPCQDSEEDDSDDYAGPRNKRQKPNNPRKQPKRQSILELEYESMMVEVEHLGDLPKNKKTKDAASEAHNSRISGGTPKSAKSKGKSHKKSGCSGKKSAKVPRKTAKQKREQECGVNQVASFFTSDVFADQAAEDAAQQPVFTSKNKNAALKELIASTAPESQKTASVDVKILLNATKDFDGKGNVKADGNSLWLVKGMKTSLKAYQVLGTAFMRRRERALEEPRGGLMADQMGLGKTLMMLANIVNGRPPRGEIKTTLLVASPNLLSQWANEIETHTACNLTVMRYGNGTRLDSNCNHDILSEFDIVLTTYHEVLRSYPKNEPPIECQTAEQKIDWWKKQFETKRGILHRIQWYRVVLDEAQAIKNHLARTSIACRALMASHRWALSGTPILNSLAELYPYFKFLRVPHTGSFKIFKNNYCDTGNPENAERLLLRLNQFMIRRTHKDVMFGAPILKLPKADQLTHWCDFNPVERNIYDIVQQRFVETINSLVESGEVDKSYSNILVMLLRLRQLTSHVLMLQFVMRDLLKREDIERIREVVETSADDGRSGHTILAIREQLDALAKEEKKRSKKKNTQEQPDANTKEDEEDTETQSGIGGSTSFGSGRRFGKEYDFKPYLNSLTAGESWEKAKKQSSCCRCGTGPNNLWLTSCHHFYCGACYQLSVEEAAEQESVKVTCKACGKQFAHAEPCDDGGPEYEAPETRSSKKNKERARTEREDLKDDWLSIGGESMLPSAKTLAIKAQILNWITENADVKIIIYTQFLPMIRILGKVCREEHWGAEQYHGQLSFQARDKAITNFAENPTIRILLASLRCGGLGLNLTMASRVIVIDPWWNSAAEQQAFCRIFRIGQKETTFMTRFCVRNTVDERLVRMQQRKQKEIDEIMEDDGKRTKRLKLSDLLRLFGPVAEDASGKPFILVDNMDSRGGFHADQDHEGYADEE